MTTAASRGSSSLTYRTAQAAVAELLRAEILLGRLPPGTRLLQNDIAERFKTSTTPVREAMRQLVAEGLLDGDPHRGVIVHETSQEELEQIYEIRLALEPLSIAATVANAVDEELAHAELLVATMEGERDTARWTELNTEFHRALADAARRPLLASILNGLRNLSALYIAGLLTDAPERIEAANEEHRALVSACRAGDVEKAIELERSHLAHTLELGALHLRGAAEALRAAAPRDSPAPRPRAP